MPYKDPANKRAYQAGYVAGARASYLAGKSCVDCGATANLEIDHVTGEKVEHRIWTWEKRDGHDSYVDCLGGGHTGYQAACWDCDWRGPAHLRGDEEMSTPESRSHKIAARAEAYDHRHATAPGYPPSPTPFSDRSEVAPMDEQGAREDRLVSERVGTTPDERRSGMAAEQQLRCECGWEFIDADEAHDGCPACAMGLSLDSEVAEC